MVHLFKLKNQKKVQKKKKSRRKKEIKKIPSNNKRWLYPRKGNLLIMWMINSIQPKYFLIYNNKNKKPTIAIKGKGHSSQDKIITAVFNHYIFQDKLNQSVLVGGKNDKTTQPLIRKPVGITHL